VEKWIRVALGPLTLEGIPRGRYRLLEKSEVEAVRKSASPSSRKGAGPRFKK
jgi:16S rRNA U516 pseudouridylate synthase RsuA-like enzyme